MRSTILSISEKNGINYLIKTVLSSKYEIILSNNVFDASLKIRTIKNINLVIVDIDHAPLESIDFISHISSSSIYKLPLIILHTNENDLLESTLEAGSYKSFQKPFNPIHLSEAVSQSLSRKTVDHFVL